MSLLNSKFRFCFRSGSKSHDSVPLWRPCFAASLVTAPVNGIALSSPFHNGTESHDSLRCGTFPSSHLPKVRGIPAFLSHLPKVRNRAGPSVAPVPAFSFPTASSHLPKVCGFSAFSAHLPKVGNRPGTLCRACTRVSNCLFPPSEGARNSRVSVSPSEGAHWNGMPDHRLYV